MTPSDEGLDRHGCAARQICRPKELLLSAPVNDMPNPKSKPPPAQFLTPAEVASPGESSTLDRVKYCLQPYTNVRPIKDTYHVGALCPDLDFLGADLNLEFRLRGKQRYWRGEIEADWSVADLADYTDQKLQVSP